MLHACIAATVARRCGWATLKAALVRAAAATPPCRARAPADHRALFLADNGWAPGAPVRRLSFDDAEAPPPVPRTGAAVAHGSSGSKLSKLQKLR